MDTAPEGRNDRDATRRGLAESDQHIAGVVPNECESAQASPEPSGTDKATEGLTATGGMCDAHGAQAESAISTHRKFLSYLPTLVCELTPDGITLFTNRSASNVTGYQPDELIGRNWWDVLYPGEQRRQVDEFYRRFLAGDVVDLEMVLTAKDGSSRTVLWNFSSLEGPNGTEQITFGVGVDLTERKRAEAVLTERESLAALIADVGGALIHSGTLPDILGRCAEALVRHLRVPFARIWTLDAEHGMLEMQASAGWHSRPGGVFSRIPLGQPRVGLVAQNRKPHLTNRLLDEPNVHAGGLARRDGMVAFAGYPLVVEERLVGVMAVFARQPLTEATLHAMSSVANGIALCIERKAAETALRESEDKYRSLFEHANDAIFIVDPSNRRLLNVNQRAVQQLGYSKEELLTFTIDNIDAPGSGTGDGTMRELLRKGSLVFERVHRRKDGTEFPVEVSTRVVEYDGRHVLQSFIRDTTQRKQAEKALRESEERYRTLVETSPDAIVLTDLDTRILLCNRQSAVLLDCDSPEELIGQNAMQFVVPEDHERTLAGQLIALESGSFRVGEIDLLRRDGTRLPVEISGSLITDAEGKPRSFIALFHDITERKRTAAALEHRLAVEAAVARASSILASEEEVDLTGILAILGQAVGASRAYTYRFGDEWQTLDNTHEWCAPGMASMKDSLQDIASSRFPWWIDHLFRNETIVVADVSMLPEEAAAERALFEASGIKSTLAVPMFASSELIGFLGFNDMEGTREWSEEDIRLLRTASEALVGYMQRKQAEEVIRQTHDELERRVEYRTGALARANQELRVEITERRRAEGALQEHLRFLQILIDAVPVPVFYKNTEGVYLGCNTAFAASHGRTKEEIVGKTGDAFLPADVAQTYRAGDLALFDQGGLQLYERRVRWADGSDRDVISYKATFQNPDGSLGGLVGTTLDISERKQAERDIQRLNEELERRVVERTAQLEVANRELHNEVAERKRVEEALHEHLRFLQVLIDAVPAPIFYMDVEGVYLGCNAAFQASLGRPKEQIVGKTLHDLSPKQLADAHRAADVELLQRGGVRVYDAHVRFADGSEHDLITYKATFQNPDGSLGGLVGTMLDITDRKRLEEQLARRFDEAMYLADHDPVTGLLNHRSIHTRLEQEVHRSRRYARPVSVIVMDLDEFKLFNDTYGHPVGDDVLQQIASLLTANARESDLLGRYGGDEFTVILPDTDTDGAIALAERFRAALAKRPYLAPGGLAIPIHMSFGIATYPTNASEPRELISCADANLYESKQHGGDTITVTQMPISVKETQDNSFGILDGLVTAVDTKDHYTRRHSEQVADFAVAIAQELGLSTDSQYALRLAGLLHDVGKIGVPDRVLRKPGRLDEVEVAIIRQHVALGELMIKDVPNLADVLAAVGSHHERVDGLGYPRGLEDGEIPLLGRIMAVADAYSSMITTRPYRQALEPDEARGELLRVAGTQLDRDLVRTFLRLLDERAQSIARANPGSIG